MVINTQDNDNSTWGMVITTHNTNYSSGGVVFNTQKGHLLLHRRDGN